MQGYSEKVVNLEMKLYGKVVDEEDVKTDNENLCFVTNLTASSLMFLMGFE